MAWLYRRFGRSVGVALLTPIAAYFLLRDGKSRRASLQYLRRLHAWPEGRRAFEREPGLLESLRHFREFAINIFDRLCVWTGEADQIEIRDEGSEHLFRLAQRAARGDPARGAPRELRHAAGPVGAAEAQGERAHVHATRGADHLVLRAPAPGRGLRVIQLDPGSIRSIFEIKACIDRGEFVGILGDRLGPGEHGRVATASFLGRPARFPLGPFLLAGLLGCPVLLSLCLRTGDARYETVVKPLTQGDVVPRAEREKRARELLEAYARSLEEACCRAPRQWFNFYDFWDAPAEGG